MATVYLALGSNLGDRLKNIHSAVSLMGGQGLEAVRLSTVIETEPVGGPPQPLFLNAVLKATTLLSPEELLVLCLQTEALLGRVRTMINGPRTIDIDILMYDDLVLNIPGLVIPHPRMKERDFVMVPLKELLGQEGV